MTVNKRKKRPAGVACSYSQEVYLARQEEKMRDADKEFQVKEKEFTKKWEEMRLRAKL